MRKLRLGESYTEKYRLEMELQLGNGHRSVRDGQQSEREGVGLESGGRNMHNLGVGAVRVGRPRGQMVSRVQVTLSALYPVAWGRPHPF